jgi:hypothetical protein
VRPERSIIVHEKVFTEFPIQSGRVTLDVMLIEAIVGQNETDDASAKHATIYTTGGSSYDVYYAGASKDDPARNWAVAQMTQASIAARRLNTDV